MNRKVKCIIVSFLVVIALSVLSCATVETTTSPAATTSTSTTSTVTTPTKSVSSNEPKYGGTITSVIMGDILYWNPYAGGFYFGGPAWITNQFLWAGDWAKGPAGGYGTKETDWAIQGYDLWGHKAGNIAESWKWTVDAAKNEGTIVYQIRQGIRYGLNTATEASRLVNGRELTADDVAFSFKTMYTTPKSMLYSFDPPLRTVEVTKTGPWEVTVKVPLTVTDLAIRRFGGVVPVFPKEVLERYGSVNEWKMLVGSGAFNVVDYVPNSSLTYGRNDKFWMADPVGPGKGNQLPYVDRYKELIITDSSTQQAALRTGKIDTMTLLWEDAIDMKKSVPELQEMKMSGLEAFAIKPRVDQPPFDDVRVRRALMMATDFEEINRSFYDGRSQILNYPIAYYPSYADIYLGLDDPDMPPTVKELYTYNPEKARQLLNDAGYPNGFKTSALMDSSEVEIYSIYKDMWTKVGVTLDFDIKEVGAKNGLIRAGQVVGMTRAGATPIAGWSSGSDWVMGATTVNPGRVNDPVINEAMANVQSKLITDRPEAQRLYRELLKYVLDQVYAIPVLGDPLSRLWWPWLKNYSGEVSVGYWQAPNWIQWAWIDGDLKTSLGH